MQLKPKVTLLLQMFISFELLEKLNGIFKINTIQQPKKLFLICKKLMTKKLT